MNLPLIIFVLKRCVNKFYNLTTVSGLVILECFRFTTLFTLAAISFSVLCSCLLNSIHYSISQSSWQCQLPIQHRITVVWAASTYLCHTLLTPGGKQLSLAQNTAVQELSSVWFLTFILNMSILMTFTMIMRLRVFTQPVLPKLFGIFPSHFVCRLPSRVFF